MPVEDRPLVAGKARHAAALLQRYARVQNDAEKAATVEQLNELFPNIRFRHQRKDGLAVYYLEDKVLKLPNSLRMAASTILKVRPDGQAEIEKDRFGGAGRLIPAVDLLAELGGRVEGKSRWMTIGGDDDWF